MKQPFHLGQYKRFGWRCWFSPVGVKVTDKKTIDQLEAEYAEYQRARQQAWDRDTQHPTARINPNSGRPVYKTRREPKNNGRPE